jgi:nucleotide-binding universal stress UspA family protein
VLVLHVIPPLSTASPGVLFGDISEEELTLRAGTALEDALREAGFADMVPAIRVGNPADEILDFARDENVDLIVIPSRGKSGLRRWMIGSVAERVVRRAPCAVLVLPIDPDEESDGEPDAG